MNLIFVYFSKRGRRGGYWRGVLVRTIMVPIIEIVGLFGEIAFIGWAVVQGSLCAQLCYQMTHVLGDILTVQHQFVDHCSHLDQLLTSCDQSHNLVLVKLYSLKSYNVLYYTITLTLY